MQLHADGPHIPIDVLRAQEEGRVVFFCGAGISRAAGLPDFGGLVEDVRLDLHASLDRAEGEAFDQKAYDRVLGLMERSDRFGPQVRQSVIRRLGQVDRTILESHRALIRLGTRRNGQIQLVTTNFDSLFADAGATRVLDAPLLPIPKPGKWDGLVHLHGRINPRDPAGTHLVLTSADFGVAYLVERWAARFVVDLFQHYDVVFVGYGVNDPVMRYLVDAVAAERRSDKRLRTAYALAAEGHDASEQWIAKGIIPILYSDDGDHAALRSTLVAWADRFNGGLDSKTAVVAELAETDPAALRDEQRQQMCWALSDDSAAPMRHLAGLGRSAHLGWVRVLESPVGTPYGFGSRGLGLVGQHGRGDSFSSIDFEISVWLAQHVADVELLEWVVARGVVLHPRLRWLILRSVEDSQLAVPVPLRDAWHLVTEQCGPTVADGDFFDLIARAKREAWSPTLELSVLRALAPCLDFTDRGLSWRLPATALDDRVRAVLRVRCQVESAGSAPELLEALQGRDDWTAIAPRLLPRADALLRDATDLLVATQQASPGEDASFLERPAIRPHGQNTHQDGWVNLIELVRTCVETTGRSEAVKLLVTRWAGEQLPIFHRLLLHSASTAGTPDEATVTAQLCDPSRRWLWDYRLQVELFPLLARLGAKLTGVEISRLQTVIEDGPPPSDEDPDRPDDATKDSLIWERLRMLLGPKPSRHSSAVMDEIEARHPTWASLEEPEGFSVYISSGWTPSSYGTDLYADLDDSRTSEALVASAADPERMHAWGAVARADPERGIRILSQAVPGAAIAATLFALRDANLGGDRRSAALLALTSSTVTADEAIEATASVIRGWSADSDAWTAANGDALLELVSRYLPAALLVAFEEQADLPDAAARVPAGNLAETLLLTLTAMRIEPGGGIPPAIRPLLDTMISSQAPGGRAARISLASRVGGLHHIDPEWSRGCLLPLFDWANALEARGVWQGYMRAAWASPSLWLDLRTFALATLGHLHELDRYRSNFVCFLASISMDSQGLNVSEGRAFLERVSPDDRATIARWLHQRLMTAADDDRTWERAMTWVDTTWPKDFGRRSAAISQALASIPLMHVERFATTLSVIQPLLVETDNGYYLFSKLTAAHIAAAPLPALAFVNSLTPEQPSIWFGKLSELLSKFREAIPGVVSEPAYERLRGIAQRFGL